MIKWRPTASGFRHLAIAATLAGIVHICVTFAMPLLTGRSAYREFAATLPVNSLRVLPPVAPGRQPLPFLLPDTRYAVCRYDTSQGQIAISASLPDAGWVMTLYNREGDNYHYVLGQPARRLNLSLLLVPPSDQGSGGSADAHTAPPAGQPLTVPASQGLLVIRAPSRGASFGAEIEQELSRARCGLKRG